MAEVNFKVSLLDDNLEKSEVRRFVAEPNLTIFKEKLKTLFGNHDNFQISWQDEDGDQVLVDSDDELKIALEEMSGPVYKFSIKMIAAAPKMAPNPSADNQQQPGETHVGVTCDGCDGPVVGYRYKCMKCLDYDLCSGCESKGLHPGHNMMRIATPQNIWPRHLFSRLSKMQERANRMRGGCHRGGWFQTPENNEQALYNLGETIRSALDPFGVDVDIDVETEKGRRNMDDVQKKAQEAKKAFMEAKKEFKEAKKEVKEVKKEVKEAKKEVKNIKINVEGFEEVKENTPNKQPVSDVLEETPKKEVEPQKETDKLEEAKKDEPENEGIRVFGTPMTQQESSEPISGTSSDAKPDSEPVSGTSTDAKPDEKDEEWTVLDKSNSPVPGAEALYPKLDSLTLSPKVKIALQAMENMGFTNEGGWLSDLLEKYDGDIGKVLDLLNPAKPIRN